MLANFLVRSSLRQKAFTLIELLTVIALLSIIATFALPGRATMGEAQLLNKSAVDLLSAINSARAFAINTQSVTTLHLGSAGANTDLVRYWQPLGGVVATYPASTLYFGKTGVSQVGATNQASAGRQVFLLCAKGEGVTQFSRHIVLSASLTYMEQGFQSGCS